MKKNGDTNNNPGLIILLGAVFSIFGAACLIPVIKSFNALFMVVAIVLLVVGVIFLIFGAIRASVLKKYKALIQDPHAYTTNAQFIKATVSGYTRRSVGVGNVDITTSMNVYKKVHYSYVDEAGVTQTVKSVWSFTPNQVEYLKDKRFFKIKCKGDFSAIVEEVPEQNKHFNV